MAVSHEPKEARLGQLDAYIDALPTLSGALIAVLHQAQQIFGYLPREVQAHIARRLKVPASRVYGVVTFYSYFSMEPKGESPIRVCMGTACFVRGSEAIAEEFEKQLGVKPGQTTLDNAFSLDCLRCVGACGLAPVVMVGEKVYGRVTKEDVKDIVEAHMVKEAPQ